MPIRPSRPLPKRFLPGFCLRLIVTSSDSELIDGSAALGNWIPSRLFSAPEIIEDAQAFPQSDVWSLGVLLYVLLSGQLPFKGESADETRENIVNVRFKFEYLYKETTMEATRLLMWIFKRGPW